MGLQLGRAHVSAEMSSECPSALNSCLLQLGRAHVSAEISQSSRIQDTPAKASIGPRSRERGNALRAIRLTNNRLASIGPRSRERGNYCGIRQLRTCASRFNWAALT